MESLATKLPLAWLPILTVTVHCGTGLVPRPPAQLFIAYSFCSRVGEPGNEATVVQWNSSVSCYGVKRTSFSQMVHSLQ